MNPLFKKVKFIAGWTPYNIGEVAAFKNEKADELIQKGYAVAFGSDFAPDAARLKNLAKPDAQKNVPAAPKTRELKPTSKPKSKSEQRRLDAQKKK